MRRIFLYRLAFLLGGCLVFHPVDAGGVPVFDVTNFAEAVQSLEQLQNQYRTLQQQYGQLVAQYQSMTGTRGMGQLFNDATSQALRNYTPATWQQTLALLSGGANPGDAAQVQAFAQSTQRSLNLANISGAALFPGIANTDHAAAFDGLSQTSVAALAVAQAAYDQTRGRAQRLQSYLSQVDSAPDMKASADLSNRLMTELIESVQQLVQLQSVYIQLQGRLQAASALSEHKGSQLWNYHTAANP
jgi:type IV secretion system protein VirB5